MPKPKFIDLDRATRECSECDYVFDRTPAGERAHRAHHVRHLRAVIDGCAPIHRDERANLERDGWSELQTGATLTQRTDGAVKILHARHDEHRAGILIDDWDGYRWFTRFLYWMDRIGRLDGMFEPDVADEVRRRFGVHVAASDRVLA